MDYVVRNYIIVYAIILSPIIFICGGFSFRNLKSKKLKWLFIVGGLCLGLLGFSFVLLMFLELFLGMH